MSISALTFTRTSQRDVSGTAKSIRKSKAPPQANIAGQGPSRGVDMSPSKSNGTPAAPQPGREVLEAEGAGLGEAPVSKTERARRDAMQSDFALLQAFQEGSEKAYAELYVRRKAEVYTYCLRMVGGDPDVASDAFQETFIKVYEKAHTFRDGTNVMGWLLMIARNTCLNIHRAKKPNETIENHQSLVSNDRSFGPEYRQEQHFLRDIIEQAIASLPQEFREPFVLREFDGLSYGEIAEITGATLAMTKVRIHRAKQKMREILRPYLDEQVSGIEEQELSDKAKERTPSGRPERKKQ